MHFGFWILPLDEASLGKGNWRKETRPRAWEWWQDTEGLGNQKCLKSELSYQALLPYTWAKPQKESLPFSYQRLHLV